MLSKNYSRKFVPDSFIKNSDDIEYSNIENKLAKWALPNVRPSRIYNTGMFSFVSSMSIKTIEQTIPIGNNYDTNLLQNHNPKRLMK